jgi:hypothetical protein
MDRVDVLEFIHANGAMKPAEIVLEGEGMRENNGGGESKQGFLQHWGLNSGPTP